MIVERSFNVVVVPVNARVDLFQQLWLTKQGILDENSTGIFTPIAVQCSDSEIELLILTNRVQVRAKSAAAEAIRMCVDRTLNLVHQSGSALMPISGCGINVDCVLTAGDGQHQVGIEEAMLKADAIPVDFVRPLTASVTTSETIGSLTINTSISALKHKESLKDGVAFNTNFHFDGESVEGLTEFFNRAEEFLGMVDARVQKMDALLFPQVGPR